MGNTKEAPTSHSKPSSPPAAATVEAEPDDVLPASYWAQIPMPEFDNDADSAIGSDAASSTASITSSILAYRTFNGRTYHAERGNAKYWAANDAKAIDAMDLWAHMLYLTNGKRLYKAPLEEHTLKKVLDIGTGSGIWAMDFADEFPDCEVTGTDISPVQSNWVPPNCRFEIEDCTQEWTFTEDSIDYIHMRLLFGSIANWDALFEQAYRVAKPGAWVESCEGSTEFYCDDNTVPANSALFQWGKFLFKGGEKIGRTFYVQQHDIQRKSMEKAGFTDVQVINNKCPLGNWPKDPSFNEIGRTHQAVLEQDAEGYAGLMANIAFGWTQEEVNVYCAHLRAEVRNTKLHSYSIVRTVIGRKPLKVEK